MRQDRNITQRKHNDVKNNLEILGRQLAAHKEKDGDEAIFEKYIVLPEIKGGGIKGVVKFINPPATMEEIISDIPPGPRYIKFSELPRLIKFLTTVAGKNGIPLG